MVWLGFMFAEAKEKTHSEQEEGCGTGLGDDVEVSAVPGVGGRIVGLPVGGVVDRRQQFGGRSAGGTVVTGIVLVAGMQVLGAGREGGGQVAVGSGTRATADPSRTVRPVDTGKVGGGGRVPAVGTDPSRISDGTCVCENLIARGRKTGRGSGRAARAPGRAVPGDHCAGGQAARVAPRQGAPATGVQVLGETVKGFESGTRVVAVRGVGEVDRRAGINGFEGHPGEGVGSIGIGHDDGDIAFDRGGQDRAGGQPEGCAEKKGFDFHRSSDEEVC